MLKKIALVGTFFSLFLVVIWGLCALLRSGSLLTLGGESAPVVVIDAGHGGEDGGALSLTGEKESVINLEISLKLEQVLALYGVETLMLRQDDVDLSDMDYDTVRARKQSDLEHRVEIINGVENPLFISIHQNSYSQEKYYGAQVFYTAQSEEFGMDMQETLRLGLDPENHRESKLVSDEIYIMNHIECGGLLIECGFLSNRVEAKKLETPEYQLKIALAIASGVVQELAPTQQT
ncbi:MAG: N-acetylmuramoyl-L-alanine amidase [Eubacteriales bacterium]